MNLQELSNALPKQWLSISAHELKADLANVEYASLNQLSAQDIETKTIVSDAVITPVVDSSAGSLSIGPANATSVQISHASANTYINGKGYIASVRPIMSGGFTMLTPVTYNLSSVETSIIGAGLGSLTTPANTISLGQSSHSVASGSLGINLSPTLTLRLKGGPTSSTVLATMPIPLSTITAGSAWKLMSDYTVKAIGGPGVAQMYINSVFVVYDTINPPTYAFFTLNTTTFDTTVNNVLTLTAQWPVASSTNTITCQQFTTNSVYMP